MCDEIRTECSSSRVKSENSSTTSSRTTGSSPLVASSRISSFELCDSAAAMPSFIFIPREKSPKGLLSGMLNFFRYPKNASSSQFLYALRRTLFACAAVRQSGKPTSSSTTPMSSLSARSEFGRPKSFILPASGFIMSSIRRMVVLLPAPFSPISPIMQPPGKQRSSPASSKSGYAFRRPVISIAFMSTPPRKSMCTSRSVPAASGRSARRVQKFRACALQCGAGFPPAAAPCFSARQSCPCRGAYI